MARLKRSSSVINLARKRLSGLSSIASDLDLSNGLNLADYKDEIEKTESLLSQYNELLAQVDFLQNSFIEEEGKLREKSIRWLNAVASIHGKDSSEYEVAGGTKTSEKKHHVKKTKVA